MIRQFYENIYFSVNVAYLTSYVDDFKAEHALIVDTIKQRNLNAAKKILRFHTRAARKLAVAALGA
jgi:DNA-binding GntR family transcriptional regulator